MNAKSIFKSKTALLGLITAACGAFSFVSEDLQSWISAHSPELLIGLGTLSIALRRITKGRVQFFPD